MIRLHRLLRRWYRARCLGFAFFGTSRTPNPKRVSIGRRKIDLSFPEKGGYLSDIIDIWLEDDYGLGSISPVPQTILDVGANIGLFSLWAVHCCPFARIHAYEPNPRVLKHLSNNVEGFPIQVFPNALGSSRGRGSLFDSSDSRLAQMSPNSSGPVEIEPLCTALDRLNGRVDLLKLDCEGGEWDILNSANALEKVHHIRMEYHLSEGHTLAELKEVTERLSFKMTRLKENTGFGIAWLERQNIK